MVAVRSKILTPDQMIRILILSVAFFLKAVPLSGQSIHSLPLGTPVVIELAEGGSPPMPEGSAEALPFLGGLTLEGDYRGLDGSRIRIGISDTEQTVTVEPGDVKRFWATTMVESNRAGIGTGIGVVLGGILSYVAVKHNGGTTSCSPDSFGGLCSYAQAAEALAVLGGAFGGGVLGGLIGAQVKVQKPHLERVFLPTTSRGNLPSVEIKVFLKNR
jgi:hypothetical protein